MSTKKSTIIEDKQRFSKSIIWQLQRKFFSQAGEKAWSKNVVPHYITSNPYIAQAYARLIFGWLRDVADRLDRSQPVYVVELGAGSGRLAYHFLKSFFAFFDKSVLRDIPITLVMTDFTQTTLDFWENHPQLKAWVESGRLDFARFDAEEDNSLSLIHQGITLASDNLKNPIAFIANYFFDGLRQDVFRIKNGTLHESLVTLSVAHSDPDLDDPNLLSELEFTYSHQPIKTADYYDDAEYNSLLQAYESDLDQTTLIFPIGSLECLERLRQMSNNNFFLIAGDKGYHHESDLFYRGEPGLSIHGSFSMMVNYHVIGQYTVLEGGQFLSTPHRHASLDICALLFDPLPNSYIETQAVYQREIVERNPDDFYTINKSIELEDGLLYIQQFLATMRLSGWDSSLLVEYFPLLLPILDEASEGIREDLYALTIQVWDSYFHIGEADDLPFILGELLFELDYYEEAIEFFQQSRQLYGDQLTKVCKIAFCHYELYQLELALEFVNHALSIDPQFKSAQALKLKIEEDLSD